MPVYSTPAQPTPAGFPLDLIELTDGVPSADVGERPGLPPRDRSLVTVATLAALCRTEQLGFHLDLALENGLTAGELVECFAHLAFYAGWPTAMTAMEQLKAAAEKAARTD